MDDVLRGKTLGFIGYGNQGRAQALNLRDSGVTSILIGNRSDDYLEQITQDNFAPVSLVQASAEADVVFLLVPDEILPDLYKRHVEPNLKTVQPLFSLPVTTLPMAISRPPRTSTSSSSRPV